MSSAINRKKQISGFTRWTRVRIFASILKRFFRIMIGVKIQTISEHLILAPWAPWNRQCMTVNHKRHCLWEVTVNDYEGWRLYSEICFVLNLIKNVSCFVSDVSLWYVLRTVYTTAISYTQAIRLIWMHWHANCTNAYYDLINFLYLPPI